MLAFLCLQVLPHRAPQAAQSDEELRWIVDTFMRLCVVGGESVLVRASGTAETDLAVRSVALDGRVQGEFQLERSRVEGLVRGIDNSITALAAQQASEARRCLEPLRGKLLAILVADRGPSGTPAARPASPAPPAAPPAAAASPARPLIEPARPALSDPSAFVYRAGGVNQDPKGFSCARAAMPMDYVICSFQEVYDINTQHAIAWWATLGRLSRPQRDELVRNQRAWISAMLALCRLPERGRPSPDVARAAAVCVRDSYAERLKFIRSYQG